MTDTAEETREMEETVTETEEVAAARTEAPSRVSCGDTPKRASDRITIDDIRLLPKIHGFDAFCWGAVQWASLVASLFPAVGYGVLFGDWARGFMVTGFTVLAVLVAWYGPPAERLADFLGTYRLVCEDEDFSDRYCTAHYAMSGLATLFVSVATSLITATTIMVRAYESGAIR